MLIQKSKSISNSNRHKVDIKKSLLSKKSKLIKILSAGKKNYSSRSIYGNITIGHKGSGNKKLYRNVHFPLKNCFSLLLTVFYDSRRSSFVSLFYDFLSFKFYNSLHTNCTFPGTFVFSYKTYPELHIGSLSRIKDIPAGSTVHNLFVNTESKYIKSAGSFGIIIQKDSNFCRIKMPSGSVKKFSLNSLCVLGAVSNNLHNKIVLGKAGKSRLMGRRPHVRGVAMNPVDHPHGGQTSGGVPSVTPWSIPTKGKPTRKKKNVKI